MASAGTDADEDVARRCRALTLVYADGNSGVFAEEVGVGYKNWNGIENTGALSKEVARQIYRRWPEVSLDWLWRGRDDGLPPAKSNELLAAYLAVAAKRKTKEKATKPAKRKVRAS